MAAPISFTYLSISYIKQKGISESKATGESISHKLINLSVLSLIIISPLILYFLSLALSIRHALATDVTSFVKLRQCRWVTHDVMLAIIRNALYIAQKSAIVIIPIHYR